MAPDPRDSGDTPALRLKVLPHGEGLATPAYMTEGAVGLDLCAAVPEGEPLRVQPFHRVGVPTGLTVAIPAGYEGQIRARSGRALKDGLGLVNGVGTIDQDYRGELTVAVINLSKWPITIRRGDRVAQFVISPVAKLPVVVVEALDDTARGKSGFGSTGK